MNYTDYNMKGTIEKSKVIIHNGGLSRFLSCCVLSYTAHYCLQSYFDHKNTQHDNRMKVLQFYKDNPKLYSFTKTKHEK